MNRFAKMSVMLCLTAVFGLAENYSGKLIDANCKAPADEKDKGAISACAPTSATTVFAVQTPDGKMYRLDSSGNSKAMAAVKADPSKTNVTISGSVEGQTLKVESIDVK